MCNWEDTHNGMLAFAKYHQHDGTGAIFDPFFASLASFGFPEIGVTDD